MSRRRKLALLAVAAGHLGLVVMGAANVDLEGRNVLGRAVEYYCRASGADNQWGFFAPGGDVTPQTVFEVRDDLGTTTETLETGVSHDVDLRIQEFASANLFDEEGEWQDAVAAAMAGKIFARHPTAESVVVRAASFVLPSMEEYRRGERPEWSLAYEATFVPRTLVPPAERDAKGGTP